MTEAVTNCARCGRATSNLRYCTPCAPIKVSEVPPVQDLYNLEQRGYRIAPISLCPLCGQLKNLNCYCSGCTEVMASVAIAAAKDAPAADWRRTEGGTDWCQFGDGKLARVSTQTGLLPYHFSILDETGQPVVWDEALDADRGRRYAECAHHLLNQIQSALTAMTKAQRGPLQLEQFCALLEKLGVDPSLPARPGGFFDGTMDLAELAYWLSLTACLRCQRYSGGLAFCEPCFDTMKWAALDVSQHAPHVDWQMTLLGEYHARFDDGHWARVYFAPVVDEPYFALEVWQEELVWVWDTCPDLATGRRYAECGHWLLHRVKEKRGLTPPTTTADALAFVTCDLAGLAFWLEQQDPETKGFPGFAQ